MAKHDASTPQSGNLSELKRNQLSETSSQAHPEEDPEAVVSRRRRGPAKSPLSGMLQFDSFTAVH